MATPAEKLKHIASKISGLPTLPTVISKLIELVDSPKTDTRILARLIYNDQSLTARILKIANSAYYGFSREISTVDTAIVVMGFNAVKEMGLSLSVFDAFKNIGSVEEFDVHKYWEHSVATGMAAKLMARRAGLPESGELFVAGLLHDIGKMVLIQYLPDDFKKVVEYMKEHECTYVEAERELIGITHAQIGALIAARWRLPDRIVSCIKNHHSIKPADPFLKEAILVNLADLISHRLNMGNDGHRPDWEVDEYITFELQEQFNIDSEDLLNMEEDLLMELDSSDFFHMISDH